MNHPRRFRTHLILALIPIGVVALNVRATPGADPIPTGPDRLTKSVVAEARLPFLEKNVIEVYQRHHTPDADGYADGLTALRLALRWFADAPEREPASKVEGAAGEAIDAGNTDPLILYVKAMADFWKGGSLWPKNETRLIKALEGLRAADNPPNHLALTAQALARYYRKTNRADEARALEPEIVDAWARTIEQSVYPPERHRLLFREIKRAADESISANGLRLLCDRIEEPVEVDPWLRAMVRGLSHFKSGWEVRGFGFAHTVNEAQWQGFRDQLERARTNLLQAYRLQPDRPEFAEWLIQITAGLELQGKQDERYWFDRAVRAQMDWQPAYGAVLWSSRPRWGGSHEMMLRFGLECAATKRYDTIVPRYLIFAILDVIDEREGDASILEEDRIYVPAMKVLEGLASHPHHALDERVLRSLAVAFAAARGEYQRAYAQAEQIRFGLSFLKYGKELRKEERDVLDEVRIFSSGVADLVRKGDRALAAASYGTAVEHYEAALDGTEDKDRRLVVRDRLAMARLARDFGTGTWVELTFEKDYPGWRVRGGSWYTPADERTARGSSNEAGYLLIHQAPIGRRFEIEGSFDCSKMRYKNKTNVGIIFGYAHDYQDADWQAILFYRGERTVVARARWQEGESKPAPVEPVSKFHVKVFDDQAVAYVNGELAWVGRVPEPTYRTGGQQFGLGGHYWYANSTAKFFNMRIRRLTEPPAELAASG